jgi:hypothetical protein
MFLRYRLGFELYRSELLVLIAGLARVALAVLGL